MKITILLLLPLLLLGLIGKAQDDIEKAWSGKLAKRDSTILNSLWKNAQNTKDSSLIKYYSPEAIKIISEDSILIGPGDIFTHYSAQKEIDYIYTAFSANANVHRGITYEINYYKRINSPVVLQLVIYEEIGDQMLRVFEYEATRPLLNLKEIPKEMGEQIKERREQWMVYCNAHQVEDLVTDLYSEHIMYFNHRPLVKGRTALIQEYAYMNSEQYMLSLHPKIQSFVNDSTVFEIGQCEGSYGGKYILIWKKGEDGVWRIFIDSNI